jgi:hypothetical protein
MENAGYYSRVAIEARYGKLTDEKWQFITKWLANEDDDNHLYFADIFEDPLSLSMEDEVAYLIENYEFMISPYIPRSEQEKPE